MHSTKPCQRWACGVCIQNNQIGHILNIVWFQLLWVSLVTYWLPCCTNYINLALQQNIPTRETSALQIHLMRNCTPNLQLACIVCYLKPINTFLKDNAFTLYFKTVETMFWSITQKLLGLLKIFMAFLSSLDNMLEAAYIIFQNGVDNFKIEYKPY